MAPRVVHRESVARRWGACGGRGGWAQASGSDNDRSQITTPVHALAIVLILGTVASWLLFRRIGGRDSMTYRGDRPETRPNLTIILIASGMMIDTSRDAANIKLAFPSRLG